MRLRDAADGVKIVIRSGVRIGQEKNFLVAATRLVGSRSGVRGIIHFRQPCGVHHRIPLRGGQRGMTQQFLNGPQIATFGQQVGRKAVPQRVGCRGFRKAQ